MAIFSREVLGFSSKESCLVWKAAHNLGRGGGHLGWKGFEESDHSICRCSVHSPIFTPMPNSWPCCAYCPQSPRVFSKNQSTSRLSGDDTGAGVLCLDKVIDFLRQLQRLPTHSLLYAVPQDWASRGFCGTNLFSPCWCPVLVLQNMESLVQRYQMPLLYPFSDFWNKTDIFCQLMSSLLLLLCFHT